MTRIIKQALLAVAAMIMAVPSSAQLSSTGFSVDDTNLYYGIRMGITQANLSGDHVPIKGVKMGFTLGGVVGLRLSQDGPVFLESGLYYTERGSKKGKQRVNYQNMEIPLLIKYGIALSDKASVLPFLGPTFSYAFWGETKQKTDGGSLETVGTFDEKSAVTGGLNRANLGLKLGCGVEYSNLYAEGGFQFGVTDICKNGRYNEEGTLHSNALFINLGVNF